MSANTLEYSPALHYDPQQVKAELLLDHFPSMEDVLVGHEDALLVRLDDCPEGTFKGRGARSAVQHYASRGETDFYAATEGNHGLGMVYAVAEAGGSLTIYASQLAAQQKIDAMRLRWDELTERPDDFNIVLVGRTYDEAKAHALLRDQGAYVDAFDDPLVIAGQGTAAIDTVYSYPDVKHIVLPVGGGGLAAGCATSTDRAVHLVEAYGNNSLSKTLRAGNGEPLEADMLNLRYGGLRVRKTGRLVVQLLQQAGYGADNMTTANDEVVKQLAETYADDELANALEGSSLVGVAGLVNLINEKRIAEGERVAVFATGHNDSPDKLLNFSQERRMRIASAQVLRWCQ